MCLGGRFGGEVVRFLRFNEWICLPEMILRGQNTKYSPSNSVLLKAIALNPRIATALLESAKNRPRHNCTVAKVLTLSEVVSVLKSMGSGISIRSVLKVIYGFIFNRQKLITIL